MSQVYLWRSDGRLIALWRQPCLIRLLLFCLILALFAGVRTKAADAPAPQDPKQESAVRELREEIRKAGGSGFVKVERAAGRTTIKVSMIGEDFRDRHLAILKNLKDLTELDVSYSKVTDMGLAHINGLKNLSKLYLTDTSITDAGLAQLRDLKDLKEKKKRKRGQVRLF